VMIFETAMKSSISKFNIVLYASSRDYIVEKTVKTVLAQPSLFGIQ